MNPSIGAISKWKYLLLLKLWCSEIKPNYSLKGVFEKNERGYRLTPNRIGY